MTLAEQIERLAQATGASPQFVAQVEASFVSRGVPLDGAATPFDELLQETFHRDAEIRAQACAALEGVLAWRAAIERLQESAERQLGQLEGARDALQRSLARIRQNAALLRAAKRPPDRDLWN